MSDVVQVNAGPNADLLFEFDGRVLEIFYAPSNRYLASDLTLQKTKNDKDGGVTAYLLSSGGRIEVYFPPGELAAMEQLFTALEGAGMQRQQ
jgi:hypothetical protein